MHRWLLLPLVSLSTGGSCHKVPPSPEAGLPTPAPEAIVSFTANPEQDGLKLRLYNADAERVTGADALARPPATTLDAAATKLLLARMPALESDPADATDLALRAGPNPPPRTGASVQVDWPGSARPAPEAAPGPLTVLRHAPDGEVPLAPHLSVTFSEPMVALTTQDAAARTVPVTLTPEVPGQWRWLGTKTLIFEPTTRFPMATAFTVDIPVGTLSATGSPLKDAVHWVFGTPPPSLVASGPGSPSYPASSQPLSPTLWMAFDQAMNPAAVLPALSIVAGSAHPALRLATAEEIAKVPELKHGTYAADRVVAVVPTTPLPLDTSATFTLAAGAPSAEGPRTTPKAVSWQLRTYGPLRVTDSRCGWNVCRPGDNFSITLSNALDPATFDPRTVQVTPAIPGANIGMSGNNLWISGESRARTTYTVTLPAALRDVYGQTLGKETAATFTVGAAERQLTGPNGSMVVADPAGAPKISVWTVNEKALRVSIRRVKPTDWERYGEWLDDERDHAPPGEAMPALSIPVKVDADNRVETTVDLTPYLREGVGHFIVQVKQTSPPKDEWRRQSWTGWVQVTKIGLTAFVDNANVLGWATELATGKPLAGALLSLHPVATGLGGARKTGDDGLGTLPLTPERSTLLLAERGTDSAFVPASEYPSRWSGWNRASTGPGLRWYLASDRGLYRPGETVRFKGWIRVGAGSTVTLPEPAIRTVKWTLRSSIGNPLAEGTSEVSSTGGLEVKVDLPKTPDLGSARLVVEPAGTWAGSNGYASVDIEEFRRPEFEVSAETGEGPWTLGEDAVITARANYYAGGALPDAQVTWRVRATPASFVPPGRDDWSFGVWTPWWRSGPELDDDETGGGGWGDNEGGDVWTSTTDATGAHRLGVHFESLRPARPMSVTAEASVSDVNRQTMASSTTLLVHPSSVYVGLKADRLFVEKGQDVSVQSLVVDRSGVAAPSVPVAVEVVRSVWTYERGAWITKETKVASCTQLASRSDPPCRFVPDVGGEYVVRARVEDAQGRPNLTEVRVWASGAEATTPDRGVAMEEITLVPDQAEVAPGGRLKLFILSPFSPAEGVLTVRSGDIVHTERISMDGPSRTMELDVPESWIPNVTIGLDLVGSAARRDDEGKPRNDLPERVAYAQGSIQLTVPARPRTLAVSVTPAERKLDPGGNTTLAIEVKDAAGAPVSGAELVLIAVDESVLALSGYHLPDPLAVFYTSRGDNLSTSHVRQWVNLVNPVGLQGQTGAELGFGGLGTGGEGRGGGGEMKKMSMAPATAGAFAESSADDAPSGGAAPGGPVARNAPQGSQKVFTIVGDAIMAKPEEPVPTTPIAVRSNFDALALWAPSVRTDATGRATVTIDLPDSLTRYRVMAVAVSGADRFGSGETDVTARLPLMVRPSPPRFLNFGDVFSLPVVIQNQTDAAMTVDVAIRGSNLTLDSGSTGGRRVVVPANDRVEVLFPAQALKAGTARWQVAAQAGTKADAASGSLPVWTPASTEAFATYGTVTDQLVVQPVSAPSDVWREYGGLEVTTSSTQLQALTDAVVYLADYPYGCSEQIGSRVLGIAALRDVLQAFSAEGLPAPAKLEAAVSADLEVLGRRQNADGGWGFWKRDERSFPYLSLHVAHALLRAKEKGFAVSPSTLERSLAYAGQIERHLPRWYSEESKRSLRAYAVYVRELGGKDPWVEANALASGSLPLEAQGWILPTLHRVKSPKTATILAGWGNVVTESAGTAHFVTGYSDGAEVLLHSDRRVDGVLLDALLRVRPDDELIPKLVAGLLAHKTAGRWGNTNESAFVLLALDRYFRVYEGVTPDFVARAWLGADYAGDHAFQGRTTERAELRVPMAELEGTEDLVLQRDGAGRLYYRIGLRYAPKALILPPVDRGFTVQRHYEPVDSPADVRHDADGTWHVKAGARVKVTVEMVTPMRRYHVALVDNLPAGFEVLNPALRGTGELPPDPTQVTGPWWWWSRPWYDHENLRDERVEAFASLLWDGVWSYSYYARATTPGNFVVPPAKAEEMYMPETFGRSAGDRLVVE